MSFQHRAPLTAIERERRAAVLAAVNGHSSAPIDIGPDDIETFPRKPTIDKSADERNFGKMAAQILRDAKRSVALASADARFAVFEQAGATLGEAVAGKWLPKNVMVDRLRDIATAHGFFGQEAGDIETMIGTYSRRSPLRFRRWCPRRFHRNRHSPKNCPGVLSAIVPATLSPSGWFGFGRAEYQRAS